MPFALFLEIRKSPCLCNNMCNDIVMVTLLGQIILTAPDSGCCLLLNSIDMVGYEMRGTNLNASTCEPPPPPRERSKRRMGG